ncbi:MAG: hypothetical protein ABI240_15010 [Sphingomonas sp.]
MPVLKVGIDQTIRSPGDPRIAFPVTTPAFIVPSGDAYALIDYLAQELLKQGRDTATTEIFKRILYDILHNMPAEQLALFSGGQAKQAILNDLRSPASLKNLSSDILISIIIDAVKDQVANYLNTKYPPEIAAALSYTFNTIVETAKSVAEGGPAALPIAILKQEYETSKKVYEATQAFWLLKFEQDDLSKSMLQAAKTDIQLLLAANLFRNSGNTARANQEVSVVNSSLSQMSAAFPPSSRAAQEWTIISLIVQAKRDALAGHSDWASQEMTQAKEAASALGSHYIQFLQDARTAFGL